MTVADAVLAALDKDSKNILCTVVVIFVACGLAWAFSSGGRGD